MASTKTIEISGSGKLSLTVDADIVTMSGRDRSFVVALLEMLDRHEVEHRSVGPTNPVPARQVCSICGNSVSTTHDTRCLWHVRWVATGGRGIGEPLVTESQCERE